MNLKLVQKRLDCYKLSGGAFKSRIRNRWSLEKDVDYQN